MIEKIKMLEEEGAKNIVVYVSENLETYTIVSSLYHISKELIKQLNPISISIPSDNETGLALSFQR